MWLIDLSNINYIELKTRSLPRISFTFWFQWLVLSRPSYWKIHDLGTLASVISRCKFYSDPTSFSIIPTNLSSQINLACKNIFQRVFIAFKFKSDKSHHSAKRTEIFNRVHMNKRLIKVYKLRFNGSFKE